jgi:hypothetical protein
MQSPCCKGVVRDPAGLTGEDTTIGDVPCYVVGPTDAKKSMIVN